MRKLQLLQTCTQYTTARNRYGDIVLTSVGTINCLFRNISTLNRNVNFREEVQVDGMFWFDPTATVKQGDIVNINNIFYRLEQFVVAQARLTNNSTHFLRCTASIYRAIS